MNIWVPKCKIIEPKREIALPVGMEGRYRLEAVGPEGVRRDSGWFDNLILNAGLDRVGTNPTTHNTCAVGTGTTAPTVSDTALETFLASTTTIGASGSTAVSSPYGAQKTWTYTFGEGVAEGNLTEVGVGWGDTTLFSRALIVDGMGSPTTFTVLSDEFLKVTYQLTCYPPLTDVEDTIDISGESYGIVLRGANVNSISGWRLSTSSINTFLGGSGSGNTAYDGAIGAITGAPSGSNDPATSSTPASYSNSNYYRDYAASWGLTAGNLGGISAVLADMAEGVSGARMSFQCSYSPAIPKDSESVLTLNFRHAWARIT